VKRKGSFSSFRSARGNSVTDLRGDGDEGPEGGVEVDKDLPPLPGLDTYVEPKVHISQLMVPMSPLRASGAADGAESSRAPSAAMPNALGLGVDGVSSPGEQIFVTAVQTPRGTDVASPSLVRPVKSIQRTRTTHSPALSPAPLQVDRIQRTHDKKSETARANVQKDYFPSGSGVGGIRAVDSNTNAGAGVVKGKTTYHSQAYQKVRSDDEKRKGEEQGKEEARRRLRREKERTMAREQRRRDEGWDGERGGSRSVGQATRLSTHGTKADQGGNGNGNGEAGVDGTTPPKKGLKNRISRLFTGKNGAANGGSAGVNVSGERGRQREVVAN